MEDVNNKFIEGLKTFSKVLKDSYNEGNNLITLESFAGLCTVICNLKRLVSMLESKEFVVINKDGSIDNDFSKDLENLIDFEIIYKPGCNMFIDLSNSKTHESFNKIINCADKIDSGDLQVKDVRTSKPYVFFIDSGHDIVKGWDVEDNADYDNYYYDYTKSFSSRKEAEDFANELNSRLHPTLEGKDELTDSKSRAKHRSECFKVFHNKIPKGDEASPYLEVYVDRDLKMVYYTLMVHSCQEGIYCTGGLYKIPVFRFCYSFNEIKLRGGLFMVSKILDLKMSKMPKSISYSPGSYSMIRLGLSLFYPTSNYYPPLAEDEGI